LIIDVQKDYCDSRLCRRDTQPTDELMPRLLGLMEAAREAGVRLIHVCTEHGDWTSTPSWLARKWTENGQKPEMCRPGTEGAEFMPGFEPLPGEVVVTKNRYSGFIGTNLDMILKSLGIKSIIATGTATNNCVEATARDGFMLDYYLVFCSDGTASYDRHLHETTLINIKNHYGTVASIDEIVGAWEQTTGKQLRKQAVLAGA